MKLTVLIQLGAGEVRLVANVTLVSSPCSRMQPHMDLEGIGITKILSQDLHLYAKDLQ